MATIDLKTEELIQRTCFPLIKEKCYYVLSNNLDSMGEPAQITNKTTFSNDGKSVSIRNTPWIGSGAMNGYSFYIAYSCGQSDSGGDIFPQRYLIAHLLPFQTMKTPSEKYQNLVLVTSDASELLEGSNDVYKELKDQAEFFHHFHVKLNGSYDHIYVYFNTESGALCIESPQALYMSKEPLYPRSMEIISDKQLCKLKEWLISSTVFQKNRSYLSFFVNKMNHHAEKMSRAKNFEKIRDIAREALSKEPRLGRDEIVREHYERLANSASANEFIQSMASYNASCEPVLGSNEYRDFDEYVKPSNEKHYEDFCKTFGSKFLEERSDSTLELDF